VGGFFFFFSAVREQQPSRMGIRTLHTSNTHPKGGLWRAVWSYASPRGNSAPTHDSIRRGSACGAAMQAEGTDAVGSHAFRRATVRR